MRVLIGPFGFEVTFEAEWYVSIVAAPDGVLVDVITTIPPEVVRENFADR